MWIIGDGGNNNLEGNSTMNDVKKVRRKRLTLFLCSFAAFVSAAIFIGHEVTHSMLSFDLTETEMLVIIASAYVLCSQAVVHQAKMCSRKL